MILENDHYLSHEYKNNLFGPKAAVEQFLVRGAGFFADNLLISREIISADDIDKIKINLLNGVNQQYLMGVRAVADRTLFGGEKLPWVMEIDSPEKVDDFINCTFPTWKQNASINNYKVLEVILMFNPPEIGTRRTHANQFVARIQMDSFDVYNLKSQIIVEIATGTNQLRQLDRIYNESSEHVLRSNYHWTPTRLLISIDQQIGHKHFENISPDDIALNVSELDEKDVAGAALNQTHNFVMDRKFRKSLEFFSAIGLNAVEIQGFVDTETGTSEAYIYGLRGPEDETKTGLKKYDYESRRNSD